MRHLRYGPGYLHTGLVIVFLNQFVKTFAVPAACIKVDWCPEILEGLPALPEFPKGGLSPAALKC